MKFVKGVRPVGSGRKKGSVNETTKIIRNVREVVLNAFNDMQKDPKNNILIWGKSNPKDFYMIAAKLIPTEISATVDATFKDVDPFREIKKNVQTNEKADTGD